MTDYAALIEAFLSKPKSATVDGQSISHYSPAELKQLIDMLKSEEAADRGELGIGIRRTEYRR